MKFTLLIAEAWEEQKNLDSQTGTPVVAGGDVTNSVATEQVQRPEGTATASSEPSKNPRNASLAGSIPAESTDLKPWSLLQCPQCGDGGYYFDEEANKNHCHKCNHWFNEPAWRPADLPRKVTAQ